MQTDSHHSDIFTRSGLRALHMLLSTIDMSYDLIMRFSLSLTEKVFALLGLSPTMEEEVVPTEQETEAMSDHTTFKTVHEVLQNDRAPSVVGKNTIMYVSSISVPLYKNPTIEFDTQIGVLPYGEMVMMLEPRGRFLKVVWNTVEGWVLKDSVVDRASRIYPEFIVGSENSVDHPNTAHVRAILGDVFGLGHSEFALQAGEYVLYRLWRKHITIVWPEIRPRVPGLWHTILRGVPRVQMSVTPKVGSVMEYMLSNDEGHVAYVEAVFPDNTISISETNYPDSGIYNERELAKDEWKELRPVFIQVQ